MDAPIRCHLPRGDRAQRTADFRALFEESFVASQRDAGVVVWTLRGGSEVEAASRRLAELEAHCCDGIRFDVSNEGDRVTWRITGPESAAEALAAFHDLPRLIASDAGDEALWQRLDAGVCGPRAGGGDGNGSGPLDPLDD